MAGGITENGCRFLGVKIHDVGEVLCAIEITGSVAAAGKDHIAHAGLQRFPEPLPQAVLIQLLQQAACGLLLEQFKVIGQIVLHHTLCHGHCRIGEEAAGIQFAIGIFQRFHDGSFMPGHQFPQVHFSSATGVGIGNIEHIPQTDRWIIHQQGDALGAFVDPAAQPVPCFNIGAGSGIGLLCVNQNLLTVIVLVVLSGCVQKVHISAGRGHGRTDFLGCQRNHGLFFARHGQPPTVIIRFTVTLSPVMDANSSPDRALEILVTRAFKRHTVSLISC